MTTAERIVELTRTLLARRRHVWVCTAGAVGLANARQVEPLSVEDDLTIWFGTSPRSRKVGERRSAGRATIAVDDSATFAAASIVCDASVADDLDERRRRWVEGLRPFFPAGPDGDDFVLVRLVPRRIELLDFGSGVAPEPFGLVPAVAERTEDGWTVVPAERGN